ncbi:MAG: methionyl-tRNA formyltransferase [Acidimicrobiia bacterium]|nr:methionyl-tRNA formyltransferase [Acidimicrobiia bacterium]
MISSIFLGTPVSSVAALEATLRVSDVRLVITRPDRPRGRSKTPRPSPVKEAATALDLSVAQPANRAELLEIIARLSPFDVGVVVAFGMILNSDVLSIPRRGYVNVHFSLLPRWRGAAPVERAVLAGDEESGVTLMALDRGLDTGSIISTRRTVVSPVESAGQLLDRLAGLGAGLLERDLGRYVDGSLLATPQGEEGVTYAEKIKAEEARLPLIAPVEGVLRRIRAFNPRPGAFGMLNGSRFKVWEAVPSGTQGVEVGELRVVDGELCLGLMDGAVTLHEVQAEGGRRMTGTEWARGRQGPLGVLT